MSSADAEYEFGAGADELARPELQGRALAPATRMIFTEAFGSGPAEKPPTADPPRTVTAIITALDAVAPRRGNSLRHGPRRARPCHPR